MRSITTTITTMPCYVLSISSIPKCVFVHMCTVVYVVVPYIQETVIIIFTIDYFIAIRRVGYNKNQLTIHHAHTHTHTKQPSSLSSNRLDEYRFFVWMDLDFVSIELI